MSRNHKEQIADNILKNIRHDMLTMARSPSAAADQDWRGTLACNLRALAGLVERGWLPDPFPHFRHGKSDQSRPISSAGRAASL